jgi:hypothetical protein
MGYRRGFSIVIEKGIKLFPDGVVGVMHCFVFLTTLVHVVQNKKYLVFTTFSTRNLLFLIF